MTASIHLGNRHWTRVRGTVTAIGTWVHENGRQRPCMVLIRTGEEGGDHTDPCMIPLETAWRWSEEIGDPRWCARVTAAFAQKLRIGVDRRTLIRLTMFIHDCLGDLLTIPPHGPRLAETPIAEVTITDEHGKTREVELSADV